MNQEPESDTPETDAQEDFFYRIRPTGYEVEQGRISLCKKLERERNEARRLLAEINRSQSTGVECHRCAGKLEPDQTCANFYCPNFTFKWPDKPI